ncbi:SERTA domain-containing protein 2 [Astyanax mexicanus]|uniref:SERTA domain-containing protein 2 n=1 Tax=Astyanax mexicanus TaxID=7994 RepID=UPI0020CAC3A4|nr:SERTA domain-containing protein 2 [Astyanax mexicanus]
MSCVMGLKRKLGREDEGEGVQEPKLRAVVLEDAEEAYAVQRQAVLQLSLQKLCAQVETALLRRVLITNTLRHVQQELSKQGAPSIAPAAGADATGVDCGSGVEVEGSLTPAWVLEQDGELFFSLQSSVPAHSSTSLSRAYQKDSFSTALAEIEDLCPTLTSLDTSTSMSSSSTSSSTSSISSLSLSSLITQLDPQQKQTQIPTGLNWSCDYATSYSPVCLPELSLDDFLFSDIDNFLCELNACSQNSSLTLPSGSTPSKVVSITDDFMRSLSGQHLKPDLNELDHIMEVLVGS